MSTVAELRAKWVVRLSEWRALGVTVAGERVATEVLADLDGIAETASESVTFTEASLIGGYSVDRLQHMVAAGTLENVGRKHRPRIRRSDVPAKPGYLQQDTGRGHLSDRRRIVASSLTQEAS